MFTSARVGDMRLARCEGTRQEMQKPRDGIVCTLVLSLLGSDRE
jgi:hypothetical protein